MSESSQAQGIGGLKGMLEQMNSIKEMMERDQAQAAQQQAEQSAQDQRQSIEFGAFVETAYLIGAADGTLSDGELAHLKRGISELTEGRYNEQQISDMIQTAAERLQSDGKQGRIEAIASVITDPGLRRAAFLVGAGLSWLDRGVGEKEGLMLQAVSKAFDIPMNEMHKLLGQAKQS